MVKHAPRLAKLHSEVPNSLREVLNISTKKWTGSKFGKDQGLHVVPRPLASALEHIAMDRIEAGEELDFDFMESALVLLIKLWNERVESLEAGVRSTVGKQILEKQDALVGHCTEDRAAEMQCNDLTSLQQLLDVVKPCNVSAHPKALK